VNGTLTGQFDRLRITGTVDLSGSTLNLSGTVPAAYGPIVLIEK